MNISTEEPAKSAPRATKATSKAASPVTAPLGVPRRPL
jgi:hypothetical protein